MSVHHSKKPWVNIELYMQSGIVEAYALGLATPNEKEEFEQLWPYYPELKAALSDFEYQLELFAIDNEEPPPPGLRERIEARIRETPAVRRGEGGNGSGKRPKQGASNYLHVEISSDHIRVHKIWRVLFIVVFIVSKIWLSLAIYYFVQNRLARQELRQTQQQMSGQQGGNEGSK
jgi:hypothetical protein